ncbi:MAG: leishmanolysin [Gemmatimonadota bacterium]|nr:leishmanolysin [Gemmatimonadota bacterium]
MLRAVTTIKDLTLLSLSTSACVACGGADSTVGPPLPGAQIEVRYLSTLTAQQQVVVAAAADKWTRAVSKDLGEFRLNTPANYCFSGEPPLSETHHNLLLFVSVADVDGSGGQLAYTQVCGVSGRDMLPILSHIRLDRADLESMEARGVLAGVITHEMGHALGFNPKSYVPKGLAGGGTDDPYFSGGTARAEFAKHGAWYTGLTVPLENSAGLGPNDPHWRYLVFGDELMVAAVSQDFKSPLSVITLGLIKDLGYEVDFSVADPYEVQPLFGGNRLVPEATLVNDFPSIAPPTVVIPLVSH